MDKAISTQVEKPLYPLQNRLALPNMGSDESLIPEDISRQFTTGSRAKMTRNSGSRQSSLVILGASPMASHLQFFVWGLIMHCRSLKQIQLYFLGLILTGLAGCIGSEEASQNGQNQNEFSGGIQNDESNYSQFIEMGMHYRLPLDNQGWAVVEPSSFHRKIYVSSSLGQDSNDGLSPNTPVASVNRAQDLLRNNSSDWLLLKRGDEFNEVPRLQSDLQGESPEQPILIGSYGEGSRPVLPSIRLWSTHRNIVLRDLHFKKLGKYCLDLLGDLQNIYVENIVTEGCESRIQGGDAGHQGITLRRSMIVDANHGIKDSWSPHADRISGIYISGVDALLIEENFADHNGWQEGYDPDLGPGPHPPSMYSHNFYLQGSNKNLIFRNNVSARAASFGAQVRPGGVVHGNVFIANNAAFYTAGDNPSLVEDNVVTIAGNKRAEQIGALGWGIGIHHPQNSHVHRNIIAHSLDPLGDQTQDDANGAISDLSGAQANQNIVYKWGTSSPLPSDILNHISPAEAPSLLAYSLAATNTSNLDEFLNLFLERDRNYWPEHLQTPALIGYFQEGFQP